MAMTDWLGIAAVITAVAGAVGVVTSSIKSLRGEVSGKLDIMEVKLEASHALLNGLSERKDMAIADAAKLEGKVEGAAIAATAMELAKIVIAPAPAEGDSQSVKIADPKIVSTKGKRPKK